MDVILLNILLVINLTFTCFFIFAIYPLFKRIKLGVFQNNMNLKLLHKSIQEQEKLIQAINSEEKKPVFSNAKPKEEIELQYERAKTVLQNGIMNEEDILEYCDITFEEMELLSGLINTTDSKN